MAELYANMFHTGTAIGTSHTEIGMLKVLARTVTKHSISAPELDWRDDGQPVASAYGDTYFSVENGLEESRYVFLQHNNLPQRWTDWRGPFCIVETGFGTALNFLMTWQAFEEQASEQCWLEFTSIEKFPMTREQLVQAQQLWPELAPWTKRLLQQYPDASAGFHRLSWPDSRVSLTLIFADAQDALPQISGPVHAWYLDGFAPSCNPDMWNEALFQNMRRLCRQTVSLGHTDISCATFTSAGLVRRGLKGAGFSATKVPGYGRKREMLQCRYEACNGPERPATFDGTPWLLPTSLSSGVDQQNIAVIGAGLAGCTTARALAERGYQVTILDGKGIANGGSGNPQGGLYVKLAANNQAVHSDFYLQAFQFATQTVERVLGKGDPQNQSWQQCGVLQLASTADESKRQQRFLDVQNLPTSLVHAATPEQASQLSGLPMSQGGLFYPSAGWVNPRHFCHQLLKHPNIRIRTTQVTSMEHQTDQSLWRLQTRDNASEHYAQVVLATAADTQRLLPDAWLPIKSIRGQLSYLSAETVPSPSTVLCGNSYMAPIASGQPWLVMGATYHINDPEPEPRHQDHLTNLEHLKEFGAAMPETSLNTIRGARVGFRCTTPDYLPMVGAIPDVQAFVDTYQPMVRNAKQIPPRTAPNYPGLWLNIGHGSRGLASTALCAELLANQIQGSSLPVSTEVQKALWPGRFLLRDMIRRKLPELKDAE